MSLPKSWRFLDRTGWPPGPWDDEPDKVEWRDEATGLPCIARRADRFGNWCGYVGVSEGHPLFEQDGYGLEVHGSITFTSFCDEDKELGVCHAPQPGESDRVWWLGFDCLHAGDLAPRMAWMDRKLAELGFPSPQIHVIPRDTYRTLEYVRGECAKLAKQLGDIG